MIEPKNEFAKILSEIERKIKDPNELEFVKSKILELSVMFMDITNRAFENNEQYEKLSNKIDLMQKSLKKIEKDIYIDEDKDEYDEYESENQNDYNDEEDFEFEIQCPYCNYEFVLGQDADLRDEIECPKCHKEIELDWDDYCDGECEHCASICYDNNLDEKKQSSEIEKEASIQEEDEQYKLYDDNQKQKNNNKLNYVTLRNNTNLKYVSYLKNYSTIRQLYLLGCENMDSDSRSGRSRRP